MISISKTILAVLACAVFLSGATPVSNPPNTGMADPVALINAFDNYFPDTAIHTAPGVVDASPT